MNWGKAIGLLILMLLTFPIGGFIWVPLLFFGWKYVKFCIKVDLIVIYLIVRLPLWLFIQLPLYSLKISTQKIDHFFSQGFNALNRRRKLSAFLMIVFGAFFLFLFPTNMQELNILSAYFWWNNFWAYMRIIVGTVGTVMIILSLIETFSGQVAQGEMPGEWARSELFAAPGDAVGQGVDSAQRAVEGVQKGRKKADQMKGVYKDIRSAELDKGALRSAVPKDMTKVLADLAESMGLRAGAAEAGAAAASNPLGWLAVAVFLLAILIFVAQLVLVTVFFVGYLQFIAPIVLGPVTAALGLGSDYGNFIGGEVADRYLAGVQVNADQYVDPVLEARQRVYCLLQGPACLRQWRLNNTRTPGSEAVGEQYLLEIDRFEVGSGEELDIAYKDRDYEIPVSFGLSNTRNGLKGINAYNVSYRIRVIDFEQGRDDPYCDTNWRPINGYSIDESDDEGDYESNDLYPGTAASTGFLTMNDFTLEECGLMQPGAGQTRTVILDVRYDYFSQATLYFDAMARETLISDPSIEKSWKESETADTPVKSALNVNSPVLYNQDQLPSGNASQPFAMRASLYTEEDQVEYQIKDFEVRKSSQVEIADRSNCRLTNAGNDNILVPSGQAASIVTSLAEEPTEGDDRETGVTSGDGDVSTGPSDVEGEPRWFGSDNSPPFFGCTMQLSNPQTISPEGETLTMGVSSNYTVKLQEPLEQFRALNSRCGDLNCPLLVTRQFANEPGRDTDNWKYTCEGPDAGRTGQTAGCSVVNGAEDWSQVASNMMTGPDKLDERIDRGEIAIDPATYDVINGIGEYGRESNEGEYAIGLTESEIEKLENSRIDEEDEEEPAKGFAIVSRAGGERDVEIIELEYIVCDQRASVEDYRSYFETEVMSGDDKLISFEPVSLDCSNVQNSEYIQAAGDVSTTSTAFGPFAYLTELAARGTYESIKNAVSEDSSEDCENFRAYDPDTEELECVG
ncbi:MAG: hypothetical protein ACI8Z7_000033 [Candidatus Nanohaloarchaea archaeon]